MPTPRPLARRRTPPAAACLALVAAGALAIVPRAAADLDVPPGWFAGDLHAHWPDSACYGVAPPEVMLARLPADLNVVSVLLWGGGGHFEQNASDYFRGADDPLSKPHQILRYDLEVSAFVLADRLGHASYLNLAAIDFPRTGYHGPIQQWARAQGAVVGSDHAQAWTASYDEFPPLTWCCAPYEAPVDIALGRVDFLEYQGIEQALRDRWRFFWYSLLDCGFRPGLAATSDSWCIHSVGSYRTYARLEDDLSYEDFVTAVAGGRTVAVEDGSNFVHFTVEGVEVGGELAVARGQPLTLSARIVFPDSVFSYGALDFIRNGRLLASHAYAQIGGEMTVLEAVTAERSSWYAARTARSHTGAIFTVVDGQPVRPSAEAPAYYAAYMDYLGAAVRAGVFDQLTPAESESLLADIDRARAIYERIRDEALAQSTAVGSESPALDRGRVTSWPNPFQHHLRIDAGAGRRVTVAIFDARGRVVRRLVHAGLSAGLVWDGRSDAGRRLPSGIYYYEVEIEGRPAGSGRAVRIR